MRQLFSVDSMLMRFLTFISDMILLSFLWLIGSLPVVTIGPSTVALYRCIFQYQSKKSISIPKEFINAFRANFKQSLVLWMVVFILALIVAADVFIFWFFDNQFSKSEILFVCIFCALVVPAISYVFPLQAYFTNQVVRTLKNAWIISICHFLMSLFVTLLNLLPIIIAFISYELFIRTLMLWAFLGVAFIAYINARIFSRIFNQYI